MANQLKYKIKFPSNEIIETHSLKQSRKNEIADWLIKHPFDIIEVYRGKKLYSTIQMILNKQVSVRS